VSNFSVHSLPTSHARIVTDEHNEIHISFEPVKCEVDESDGSFYIHLNHYPARITTPWVQVVETGHLSKDNRYSFSKKSQWHNDATGVGKMSEHFLAYVNSPRYFQNDIQGKLNQQKVGVCV